MDPLCAFTARLQRARLLIDVERREARVPGLLRGEAREQQRDEERRHRGEQRQPLAPVAHHAAEGHAERRADQQDREHLEEVRKRRRVLERVGGVRVEEAAAVGAELLDRDLRGGRPHREQLLGHDLAVGAAGGVGLLLRHGSPSSGRPHRTAVRWVAWSAPAGGGTRGRRSADLRSLKWNPLPGTGQEADALLATMKGLKVYRGEQATEGALKKIHAPRILHLATHGFFLPDEPPPPEADQMTAQAPTRA